MDPTIMKLLEDDEDESMHSGADVEALTAALNRDIGRTDDEISQDSEPSTAAILSQGSNSTSSPLAGQWQTLDEEINRIQQSDQLDSQKPCFQEHEPPQVGDINQQPGSQDISPLSDVQQEKSQSNSAQEQHQNIQQQQQHQLPSLQTPESESNRTTEQGHVQIPEKAPSHVSEEGKFQLSGNQPQFRTQQFNNQQGQSSEQANTPMRRMKLQSIPFHSLIPILRPHLDKDRTMQLNNVFAKLKSKEIGRDDFLRVIRNIVGDQMLRQAAHKMMQQQAQQGQVAARNSQTNQNQLQVHNQAASQLPQRSLPHGPLLTENRTVSQLHPASSSQFQTGQTPITPSAVQMHNESHLNGKGIRSADVVPIKKETSDPISLPVVNSQQTHALMPSSPFHMPGTPAGNYGIRPFQRSPIASPAFLPQAQGSVFMQNAASDAKRLQAGFNSQFTNPLTHQNQIPWHPSGGNEQTKNSSSSTVNLKQEPGESNQPQFVPVIDSDSEKSASSLKNEALEKQPSRLPPSTANIAAAPVMSSPTISTPESATARAPSGTPQTVPGANLKTPQKKPSVGQKKPLDSQSTPPASSKKQKVTGAFQDQSIEQLNDVTAVSGVNLREEEEQLLAAPKEETRASEAARRAVQEEEERLILHKSPLQKKIAEIMSKCGIENAGSDVNRCLSMCVEERLRGIISSLVRVSKKRLDIEKARHQIVFTSDVRRQILEISQKAKEEWEKKQAEEVEKLKKPNDTSDGSNKVDSEKDKDEARSKAPKVQPNKEEDDKMRTTAANVAARVAVGGDDMLSKWQLMAEQARQKREGSSDGPSGSQTGKLSGRKALHGTGRTKDTQEGDKKGAGKKGVRNMTSHGRVARNITVKDLISVLEREHQMSKSSLLYRLYDRMSNDQPTE